MKGAWRCAIRRRVLPVGLPLALAAAALASACTAQPPPLALHNLERPTDMVFGCVGLFDQGAGATPLVSGRPMPECHAPGRFDAPPDPTRRTFGFVTNTARGELSVIDMDASKLVDLDPANPDTNVAPLGVLPEQIAASDDGCRIVSANRGSCDLTMVDVGALVSPTLIKEDKVDAAAPSLSGFSQQVVVSTGDGHRLRVAPQEILFLPQDTSSLAGAGASCGSMPVAPPIGWSGAYQSAPGWKAVVSFPSCDMVALVDLPWAAAGHLSTATIIDSVQMTAGSDGTSVELRNTGANPTCPEVDFCDNRLPTDAGAGDGAASTSLPDGGSFDGDPFVNPTGVRPGPLAVRPGGDRVYVGLGQAAFVIALDLRAGQLVIPDGAQIPLHEGARGVDRVRLSVDPYQATGIPGQYGRFVGEGPLRDRQFLYAIARDGTVRVVDVSRSARLLPEIECDANIDPANHPDPTVACMPVNEANAKLRRPFSVGPGIKLPSVPRDVAAVDLTSADPRNNWEGVLDGAYAFVLTSSGAMYIVNIAPTLRTKTLAGVTNGIAIDSPLPETQPLVNSLRDRNALTFITNQDATLGPPRLDVVPTVPPQGPEILSIASTSARDNPLVIKCGANGEGCEALGTFVFFPKRSAVQRQTWTLTWEGSFVGPSFTGQLVPDPDAQTMTLKDLGVGFCSAGVLPGDFVTLFGCTADAQCGPEQVCKRSDTAPEAVGTVPINGLCMPADPTEQARRFLACKPLLDSVRRYEITEAKDDQLTLRPRIDEVASATLDTCAGPRSEKEHSKCEQTTDPSRNNFTCESTDSTTTLRCVQVCDPTAKTNLCRTGRTCVTFDGKSFCADAPTIDATIKLDGACPLDQLLAYRISAGSSFLVQGTAPAVYIPGQIDPVAKTCQVEPQRLDRIPLFETGARTPLARCPFQPADIADPTPADLNATFLNIVGVGPNDHPGMTAPTITAPCLIVTATMSMDATGKPVTNKAYYEVFQNRELRFVLANLEKYLGDFEQIIFDVHGGFQADAVLIPGLVAMDAPARVLLSPIDAQGQSSDLANTHELPFLFVVDQRRLARASLGLSGTRGQVLRVYSRKPTGSDANSLLPVYDDPTSSANLWPIQ